MPDVSAYDNQSDWMHDCVPTKIDEGQEQKQAVAVCLAEWREKDKKAAVMKTEADGKHPAGHYLVVEDPKAPTTWHLRVRDTSGKPDHTLMGAAWAALHGGYRGNKYEGPGKTEAISKLRALYESEKLSVPGGEKAGRRLRGDWAAKLKALKEQFTSWLKDLGDMEAWADYADEPPITLKGTCPCTFKARDGKAWYLTWTTNAFEDRDQEIFSTKAIEDYVARHEGDEAKGEFQLWHLPGTKFGEIRWQAVVGRFLAEAGPFDDTPQGQRFKQFFEAHPEGHPVHAPSGWATSHGYSYKEGDRDDGVYDWFDKRETSVLPFEAAANQHNPQPEVIAMNDRQKALLREIGGDELVEAVIKTGESQTKALEEQGVAFKEGEAATTPTEAPPTEEKAAESTPCAVDIKAIAEELKLGDLSDTIAALTEAAKAQAEAVKALQAQVAELNKADETKVAEKMAGVPRFSWMRASQAAATVLDPTTPQDAALKAKKQVPHAIAGIAEAMTR